VLLNIVRETEEYSGHFWIVDLSSQAAAFLRNFGEAFLRKRDGVTVVSEGTPARWRLKDA
jgi:hypothetical protein